jgi:hypothetical protein
MGSKALWISAGLLAAAPMAGQVPASERIPVTDPVELIRMGFPGDAKGVFLWSKLAPASGGPVARKAAETWGPAAGYTAMGAHDLQTSFANMHSSFESMWCPQPYEYDHSTRAQLDLPDGAELLQLQFWGYDDHPQYGLNVTLHEICQPAGLDSPVVTVIASADTFGAIGHYYGFAPIGGVTVNNRDCGYALRVEFAPSDSVCFTDSIQARKFQIVWQRQVHPAPPSATFGDVPTGHMFFQFVEALAKSGITGGCGNGNFCPDQPLKRGQMAAFLAKALGLEWP